jgi:hypothetical protein
LAARFAAADVRLAADAPVRRVVVVARFAVVATRLVDFRAEVEVPLAPALAARPVAVAPRAAVVAVRDAPRAAD